MNRSHYLHRLASIIAEEEALSPPDEHVWVLKGDHTTRVSSEDRAAVVASLDASVAKYFAEARGETYEPEEEAEEEPEELVEAVEDVPVEVEDEVESAPPSESGTSACGHFQNYCVCFSQVSILLCTCHVCRCTSRSYR